MRSRRPANTACLRRPSWPQLPIWGCKGGCPAAWLRVAASGCLSEFLVRRALPPSRHSLSVVIGCLVPARPQCRSCVVLGAIASMVCASPAPPDALGPWWACQAQTALAHAQLGIPAPSDHRVCLPRRVCERHRPAVPSWAPQQRHWGSDPGMSAPSCSGLCTAGYVCLAGSNSSKPVACGPGRYSDAGQWQCTLCPAGTYGARPALPNSSCSGNCSAGYVCPPGSTMAQAQACALGRYSLGAGASCLPCPDGTFDNTTALATAACSGNCSVGYACRAGATTPVQAPCTPGRYSGGGVGNCDACPTQVPYSAAASGPGGCTNCSTGCTEGTIGIAMTSPPCPDDSWTVYDDGGTIELNASCWKMLSSPVGGEAASWGAAQDNCSSLAPGSHLLTSSQVRWQSCFRLCGVG